MITAFKKAARTNLASQLFLTAVVIIAGVVVGGTVYLGIEVGQLRNEVAVKSAEINFLTEGQDQFLNLKASLNDLQKQQAQLLALVPTKDEVLLNIESLEQLAALTNNNQEITINEPLPTTTNRRTTSSNRNQAANSDPLSKLPSNIQQVDYAISLHGTFVDLMSYIMLFEHQPFIIAIQNVRMSAATTGAGNNSVNTGLVDTRIEGKLFYLKE